MLNLKGRIGGDSGLSPRGLQVSLKFLLYLSSFALNFFSMKKIIFLKKILFPSLSFLFFLFFESFKKIV